MAKRRNMTLELDGFRALDKERRELITANEQRKSQRNKASDEIARLKKEKQSADALIAEMKQVSERIKRADERVAELDATQKRTAADAFRTFRTRACLGDKAPRTTRRCAAGALRRNLIFSRSRTGKLVNARGSWIWRPLRGYRSAVCCLQGLGCAAGAGAGEFFSRCAHAGTRLYGDFAAVPGEYGFTDGRGPIAEVCRGSFQAGGHGFLADADLGGGAAQSVSRRHADRGAVADSS